jgi:hypothetical protein
MKKILATALTKAQSLVIAKFIALLGVATFLPMFLHLQWLTGPIINAILIIAVVIVGVREALLIALIPSSVALAYGLLPLPLAPMVPFIMMSNALLVWVFDMLRSKNYWLGVGAGAVLKFLFLFLVSQVLLGSLLTGKFLTAATTMMSWPQLVTALIGGVLAYGFLKFLKYQTVNRS